MRYPCLVLLYLSLSSCHGSDKKHPVSVGPPNILIAISDDQSYPHASAYGCKFVNTSGFDRVAREGILFQNCFSPSPSCSPTRASLLTGRNIWQNEEAGLHVSLFPKKFEVLPDILESNGYHVGFTGKGWGPGNWKDSGWEMNPAGPSYNKFKNNPPTEGLNDNDYASNFNDFLKYRKPGQPFYFWYGGTEPHRGYEYGSGYKAGKTLASVEVPAFLYDDSVTRMDMLDYALEIEWFDKHLIRMIKHLEEIDELDNTLIIVTSDNGMPFPRAKPNLYEYGTHIPLAIMWGEKVKGNRKVNDFISLIDIMPTILDATGIEIPVRVTGNSLLNILYSHKSGWTGADRDYVLTGKERHNIARIDNLCYPIRAIRNKDYLYLRNFKPDRWPSGDPPDYRDSQLEKVSGGVILKYRKDNPSAEKLFKLNVAKRPEEELYKVSEDPGCINNLAGDPEYSGIKAMLWIQLKSELEKQGDPRIFGKGDVFDKYPFGIYKK